MNAPLIKFFNLFHLTLSSKHIKLKYLTIVKKILLNVLTCICEPESKVNSEHHLEYENDHLTRHVMPPPPPKCFTNERTLYGPL